MSTATCEHEPRCATCTGAGAHSIEAYTHPAALDARRASVERFKAAVRKMKSEQAGIEVVGHYYGH